MILYMEIINLNCLLFDFSAKIFFLKLDIKNTQSKNGNK